MRLPCAGSAAARIPHVPAAGLGPEDGADLASLYDEAAADVADGHAFVAPGAGLIRRAVADRQGVAHGRDARAEVAALAHRLGRPYRSSEKKRMPGARPPKVPTSAMLAKPPITMRKAAKPARFATIAS